MERLGKEPNPDKAPIETYHFPYEVQLAFSVHTLLPDRWDGMNGVYLGKDWAALGDLLDIYEVESKKEVVFFIKYIEHFNSQQLNDKAEQQRKKAEQTTAPGTKMVRG